MILGISAFHHDSAVSLVDQNEILFASHEERFSRIKFDASWPAYSLEYCIKKFGVPDTAVFYDTLSFSKRLDIKSRVRRLGIKRCEFIEHHNSHAYSSICMNNWEPGAVLVVDTKGGHWATSLGYWDGKKLNWLKRFAYPNSLGLFYSSVTKLLGFTPLSDEQKVMSAAMYGTPKWASYIKDRILHFDNNSYYLLKKLERGVGVGALDFDIAASAQFILEQVLINLAKALHKDTGSDTLYYSGGVALNCVANSKIYQHTHFKNIFIQPSSGDAGGALGASVINNNAVWKTAYLGFDVGEGENPIDVATKIAKGEIVQIVNGKAEFGPRALGNRSYLCLPTKSNILKLNSLKERSDDTWRPYAPVCRDVDIDKYFDVVYPSKEMMFVSNRKTNHWISYPDDSARLQIVSKSYNSYLHEILSLVSLTRTPVLINTSLNKKGKPIINSKENLYELN